MSTSTTKQQSQYSNSNNNNTSRGRRKPTRGGNSSGRTRTSATIFRRPSPQDEIPALTARIAEETPARGTLPYAKNAVVSFASQPLSQATLQGLHASNYTTMTPIQSSSIPHALAGRDILGASQTGSGKSLAFLIPLLELLYRQGFAPQDGVGAIVLSPTRELAGQLFAVLKKIGRHHSFSLGLVMGGQNKHKQKVENNDFVREQQALPTTNILICTPGRLLQHLEQTPYFNVDALQMLVLDEADRILDMGFRDQLLKILDYLPTGEQRRQTLLFSATQTKSVKDLATLSINRNTVEYVGIRDKDNHNHQKNAADNNNGDDADHNDHDNAHATPHRLKQSYVLVPLPHKLNCLYSFLKSHLKCKTMVFFNTCSQVRHAWDLFCRLRPGLSVLAIHGKLSQTKRLQVYDKFTTTPHSVLLCTDVASRGLDFPSVEWVIQVDAPEDYDMYVHRVGRTARHQQAGNALLLLDPAEEASFIEQQQQHSDQKQPQQRDHHRKTLKAPLHKKAINPTKTMLVTQRAASLVAEHATLYALAKKAFWSYVRSISLLPKDGIWSSLPIRKLSWEEYAISLGLPEIPAAGDRGSDKLEQILSKAASREGVREAKNVNRKLQKLKEQIRLEKEAKKKLKLTKKRKAQDEGDEIKANKEKDDDDIDDLLILKSKTDAPTTTMDEDEDDDIPLLTTATSTALRKPKKIRIDGSNSNSNQHTKFEDDGTEQPKLLAPAKDDEEKLGDLLASGSSQQLQQSSESYLEEVRQRLERTKELDKQEERERIRAKHKKKRLQDKTERAPEDGQAISVIDTTTNDDVAMQQTEDKDQDHSSSGDSDSSTSSSDDDGTDDGAENAKITRQEDDALSMIRRNLQ